MSSGLFHLVIAVDLSRSAREYRGWQAEAAVVLAEACGARLVSLIAYASRALPLVIEDASPGMVRDVLGSVGEIAGIPEPVAAAVESSRVLYLSHRGSPRPSLVVIFWSMPRKPRRPARLALPPVESIGAELAVIGLPYTRPRWLRDVDLGDVKVVYRRRMKPRDLPRRLGCQKR